MSTKKRMIIFFIFIILFILLIPVTILYSTGYHLGKGLRLEATGGVYVYSPQSGTIVTIKGLAPQKTSIFTKSVSIQNLNPGTYEIDVSKAGYSYWKKNVLIQEKRVSEAYPFLVLEPLATSTISTSTRPIIEKLFTATSTVTTVKPISILSYDATSTKVAEDEGLTWRNINLYKEKNKNGDELIALWKGETGDTPFYFCSEKTKLCDSSLVATISLSPIKHFDFYPGRNDVVIYSNNDGVFVTELDLRSPQNFVTLATGKVDFRVYNGHIYLKEKSSIYEVIYD